VIKFLKGRGFNQKYINWVNGDRKRHELFVGQLKLFLNNPLDTRLRTHKLRRRLAGKFAFSLDADSRVVFEWVGKNTVRFLNIGSHREVYPKRTKPQGQYTIGCNLS
jgi:mRNA-degrading endonuclease YafQ of YafQ-DinJ toxin-antitoxin module